MSFFSPQNPGIGGLDELTTAEELVIQSIASLTGNSLKVLRVNVGETGVEWTTLAAGGDVSKVGTPVNNQVGVWTGDGTLEGDTALTFDTATDTLSSGILNATSMTASELTATDASKNLVSLAVATYPSLTEISYVKGVTSAIQTQIGTKAPSTAPTFATSITGSYLTASEMLITDGSKNIVSAPVATYPSLTELSYVKGLTSAIQTQLGGKQATITFGTGVETALGVNIGSAGAPVLFDGALGTPSSGTLTNCTGLPVNGIVDDTTSALGVGTLELGHASDTTLSRASAGVVAVEGVTVPTISSTSTLTNKRVTPRVSTATSYTTDTGTSLNCDTLDRFIVTAQAGALKLNNPTGTPTDGQVLFVAVTGTAARALTYDTQFEASTVALPTTTVTTARLNMLFVWRADTSKWVIIASA